MRPPAELGLASHSGEAHGRRPGHVSYSEFVDRWAVIVGISSYKHSELNLRYADRDADALYHLIQTPSAGGFEADHIYRLINQDANMVNVTRALRSFLKKPAKDDIVLIYFACHGAPDPDRPDNIYLLTYETDPDDISGTALPMREIELSLKDNLLAERVVILADTCHSAIISGNEGRRSIPATAVVNSYLRNLSNSQSGIALLTSAEANEVSLEHERWGNGHGVFTYYLLEGMKGRADYRPRNGTVTVGELFEYVRENVQQSTNHQQHPFIGPGRYDRNLPMAVTGGITAGDHYRLGCQLYRLGQRLGDLQRFQSAKKHLYEAIRLSRLAGAKSPEFALQLGLILLALNDYRGAVKAFEQVNEPDGETVSEVAFFYLGIAYAKLNKTEEAQAAFETFLQRSPQDDKVALVGQYVEWLKQIRGGRKYALLIGISSYADARLQLRGPENDVRLMEQVLSQEGVAQDITILRNEDATRRKILEELDNLGQKITTHDSVVVYFSGHGISESADAYLIPYDYDYDTAQSLRNIAHSAIGTEELHRALNGIPTTYKTVILDTDPNVQFLELAEKEANFALLLSSSPGTSAHEFTPEDDERRVYGAFTHNLVTLLASMNLEKVTYQQIVGPLIEQVRRNFNQIPAFVGIKNRSLFGTVDDYSNAFEFSQRRHYELLSLEDIRRMYSLLSEQLGVPYPEMHYSFGRAFMTKGSYLEAIHALRPVATSGQKAHFGAMLSLGFAQVGARRYTDAHASFRTCATLNDNPEFAAKIEDVMSLSEELQRQRKHALLVGVNEHLSAEVPSLRGAVNDVLALKDVLCARFGFEQENLKVLLNEDATRNNIMKAFQQLVEDSRDGPALFYFAGNGSTDNYSEIPGAPTLVSVDGRQDDVYDINLEELSELASDPDLSLVTIIDAGWTMLHPNHPNRRGNLVRTIASDTRPRPRARRITLETDSRDLHQYSLQIGRLTLYPNSIGLTMTENMEVESAVPESQDGTEKSYHGRLTYALTQSLKELDPDGLTYTRLLDNMKPLGPVVVGDNPDQPVFSSSLQDKLLELYAAFDRELITNQTISILRRLIEQRGGIYPEGHLNLGVAYAAKGNYPESIKALKKALAQGQDNSNFEARYHLGRSLLESQTDLAQAVSELRQVTEQEPNYIPAYYYLGQAIRALVERETLGEAEKVLRKYLENGAPLGHEEDVRRFVDSRNPPEPLTLTR